MNDVLEIKELSKRFGENQVIDGLSLRQGEGECLGLVGESGCGKSTLAGLLAGLLRPDRGEIRIAGQPAVSRAHTDRRIISSGLQMVFQHPAGSFDPRKRMLKGVMEPLYYEKLSGQEKQQRAEQVMEQVGLNRAYLKKYPWELSGGECQRAALARAVIGHPKLLVCDEVTSALDVSVQAQIVRLLDRLRKEEGLSILFISHDMALVCALCDRVAVMCGGRIIESAAPDRILSGAREEYTRMLAEQGGLSC